MQQAIWPGAINTTSVSMEEATLHNIPTDVTINS